VAEPAPQGAKNLMDSKDFPQQAAHHQNDQGPEEEMDARGMTPRFVLAERRGQQRPGQQDVDLETDGHRPHQFGLGAEKDDPPDPGSHAVEHVVVAEKHVVDAAGHHHGQTAQGDQVVHAAGGPDAVIVKPAAQEKQTPDKGRHADHLAHPMRDGQVHFGGDAEKIVVSLGNQQTAGMAHEGQDDP
jgi:hypothetical protein